MFDVIRCRMRAEDLGLDGGDKPMGPGLRLVPWSKGMRTVPRCRECPLLLCAVTRRRFLQWVQGPPGNCSGRKLPEKSWRQRYDLSIREMRVTKYGDGASVHASAGRRWSIRLAR